MIVIITRVNLIPISNRLLPIPMAALTTTTTTSRPRSCIRVGLCQRSGRETGNLRTKLIRMLRKGGNCKRRNVIMLKMSRKCTSQEYRVKRDKSWKSLRVTCKRRTSMREIQITNLTLIYPRML